MSDRWSEVQKWASLFVWLLLPMFLGSLMCFFIILNSARGDWTAFRLTAMATGLLLALAAVALVVEWVAWWLGRRDARGCR